MSLPSPSRIPLHVKGGTASPQAGAPVAVGTRCPADFRKSPTGNVPSSSTFRRSRPLLGNAWRRALTRAERTAPEPSAPTATLPNSRLATPAGSAAVPGWVSDWEQAFAEYRTDSGPESGTVSSAEDVFGCRELMAPLLRAAERRVARRTAILQARYGIVPFDARAVADNWLTQLPRQCARFSSQTLALELNVDRLNHTIAGRNPEARFARFVHRLRRPAAARALCTEYPVLARLLTEWTTQSVEVLLEALEHYGADRPLLGSTFPHLREAGALVRIEGGAGDVHGGGRSVLRLQFAAGDQLIYKPRSLAAEVHFFRLLSWLNERGLEDPFRVLSVLDCGSHGWVEFVRAEPCHGVSEVRRFYERQGAFLALLYALQTTDVHHENLIAAGEHPVLVDLESVFQPRLEAPAQLDAEQKALDAVDLSVLRVGLLPQRYQGLELSGLGGHSGQVSPWKVLDWEGVGTDTMHVVRRPGVLPGAQNRPVLAGVALNAADYADAIATGFEGLYRLLLDHRDELLAPAGPLSQFAGDEVRVVLRATKDYADLLGESLHPDLLRDADDRDRFFDWLNQDLEFKPWLSRVLEAERQSLWQSDIPRFTTRLGSLDLWTSSGERIPGFFTDSSLVQARQQIERLSPGDLERQLWFTRSSLAILTKGDDHPSSSRGTLPEPGASAAVADAAVLAGRVGAQLEKVSLRRPGLATWLGLNLEAEEHWALMPLGPDLYGGLPGIALFLGYLGAVGGEARFTTLAEASVATARAQLARYHDQIIYVGAFDGWGGWLYVLSHLAVLWQHPHLLAEAEAVRETIARLVGEDEGLDIISGAAGAIGSLLSLHRVRPSERTLAVAAACGDRLIHQAQRRATGIGWANPASSGQALLGFSHGVAGIAWALLRLSAVTGEPRFREAALQGLAYERAGFSEAMHNWPVLRPPAPQPSETSAPEKRFMSAWCHGAPGIGLARLSTLQSMDDAETRSEIRVALKTTLREGFGHNHSLCHGDLGNLELLLEAGRKLGDARWQDETRRVAGRILASIKQNRWLCGVPHQVETPGLMTGLAGIGYELLRLAAPDRVPSVLTLEPPAAAS